MMAIRRRVVLIAGAAALALPAWAQSDRDASRSDSSYNDPRFRAGRADPQSYYGWQESDTLQSRQAYQNRYGDRDRQTQSQYGGNRSSTSRDDNYRGNYGTNTGRSGRNTSNYGTNTGSYGTSGYGSTYGRDDSTHDGMSGRSSAQQRPIGRTTGYSESDQYQGRGRYSDTGQSRRDYYSGDSDYYGRGGVAGQSGRYEDNRQLNRSSGQYDDDWSDRDRTSSQRDTQYNTGRDMNYGRDTNSGRDTGYGSSWDRDSDRMSRTRTYSDDQDLPRMSGQYNRRDFDRSAGDTATDRDTYWRPSQGRDTPSYGDDSDYNRDSSYNTRDDASRMRSRSYNRDDSSYNRSNSWNTDRNRASNYGGDYRRDYDTGSGYSNRGYGNYNDDWGRAGGRSSDENYGRSMGYSDYGAGRSRDDDYNRYQTNRSYQPDARFDYRDRGRLNDFDYRTDIRRSSGTDEHWSNTSQQRERGTPFGGNEGDIDEDD
jgi:hypothetical protein